MLHRVATSSCCRHVDELATEPFLLLHRKHGTGYRRSWNCCNHLDSFRRDLKTFLFHSGYRMKLWCALGLLVGGAIQMPQLQLQLLKAVRSCPGRPGLKYMQDCPDTISSCRSYTSVVTVRCLLSYNTNASCYCYV